MTPATILHALGDLVLVLDREHRVTAAFGKLIRTGARDASQFIGKAMGEAWPTDLAGVHSHMNSRALEGQVVVYDWEYPFPGSGYRVLSVLCPLYAESDRETTGVLRIARMIGEQARPLATHAVSLESRPQEPVAVERKVKGRKPGRRQSTGARPVAAMLSGRLRPSEEVERLARKLSPRERLVVAMLFDASRVPQIARELNISHHTVRQHVKHILRKANVHSQQELLDLLRGKRRK
jgi:DNA-binding CsgD family transcriptional regulator